MLSKTGILMALGAYGGLAAALPTEDVPAALERAFIDPSFNHTEHLELASRAAGCGDPPAENPRALCGALFQGDWKAAALAAAPQFNFARENPSYEACYPEGATNTKGDGINPGTGAPNGLSPGKDCTNPGKYTGSFSDGDPFPVYVDIRYCDGPQPTWRILYNLYYVHDSTHKHDWEVAAVVWKKTNHEGWWTRHAVVMSMHSKEKNYKWEDLFTVDGPEDKKRVEKDGGQKRNHPNLYIGMWKNGFFYNQKTSCHGQWCSTNDDEYRSNDWVRIPTASELRAASDLNKDWKWGGTTKPYDRMLKACDWEIPAI
ncbi:hypothetical protein JX266_008602 [Neoarthrinium moseri]|nr:hypothetical protein JX266_008602 [Neoarthrinium moseri]